ncbi:type IV secretion system protein [Candidatus Saccharibacteria bacterium]|nr:type IV secretion system protein [Candidatus Saccharibacteria bacterium]
MRIRRFAGLAFAFIIGACFMFGIVFGSETVFAKDVTEVEKLIVDKAVYQGVYKCYNGGFVSSQIDSLANYDGDLGFLLSKKVSGENYVPLVTGISSSKIFQASRYKVRDNGLSCAQIINGGAYAFGGSNQNILQASGKTMPAKGDTNAVVDLAENFGYKVTKSGNGNCYGLRYSRVNGSTTVEGDTNSVCVDGEKLTVQAGTENTSGAANKYMTFSIDGSKICLEAKGRSAYTSNASNTTTKHYCENLNSNSDLNGQWLMDKIVAKCEYDNDAKKYSCNGHLVSNSISSTFSQNSLSNYSANFNSASNAALTAIRFLSGNDAYTSNASLGLDRVEKRMLYQDYLESYYKVNVDCSDGALGDDINWLDKTASPPAVKKCKIAAGAISNASNKTKKVNGVDSKGYFVYESLSLNDLVNEIKKMPTNYTDSELSEVESLVNSGVEGQEDGEGRCAGAGALGWFVCPIIEWLSTAAEDLYSFVEPMLQISPQLFSGETSNVEQAWGTFRDIANVAFVILLLMVIISQITGVGIDNYGIKKILPKMIVAAILINLSYIICLIFVDLSNILGNGFQGMFNGLGSGLAPAVDIDGQGGPITDTVIPAVSVLAIIGGIAAVLINPAMILTLLVSAISVVVSLFFLFILLVSREAVIVVLVVISPLAVVCYMLPNTKSLFDRWIKILEGLLLLYPICGLLVGAGSYISKLLLSSGFGIDGFVQAFAAMIVGVVPIFFIPMVLRNSFAALGNMGAKLSGIGQGIGKSLTGAVRDSDAYKNAQKRGLERQARIFGGINADGTEKNLTGVGRFLRGGNRGIAAARAQYLADRDAQGKIDRLTSGAGFEAAMIGQAKRREGEELADYMTLINKETANGEKEDKLFSLFDSYVAAGNTTGAVAVARIAGRRKDTAARFAESKLTSSGQMGPSVTNTYSNEILKSLSKEISTGENSETYRQSSPFAFEFAADINRGTAGTTDYNTWLSKQDSNGNYANVSRTLKNYIANDQDLVGMKGGALRELKGLIDAGMVDDNNKARIEGLATQAIENRSKPGTSWDSTKAEELAALSGKYNYDKNSDTLTLR